MVSLKEGMFNNANVLFKTAFIDGVSTVRRNAQSRKAIEAKEDRENAGKGKAAAGKGRTGGNKGRRGKLAASN